MCNYYIQKLDRKCKLKTFKDDLCKCHYKIVTKCSICLESLDKIHSTVCNHDFHEECINKWLETKTTCPLCRYVLREHDPGLVMDFGRTLELTNSLIDMFQYIITMRRVLNISTNAFIIDLTGERTEIYNNELEELNQMRNRIRERGVLQIPLLEESVREVRELPLVEIVEDEEVEDIDIEDIDIDMDFMDEVG